MSVFIESLAYDTVNVSSNFGASEAGRVVDVTGNIRRIRTSMWHYRRYCLVIETACRYVHSNWGEGEWSIVPSLNMSRVNGEKIRGDKIFIFVWHLILIFKHFRAIFWFLKDRISKDTKKEIFEFWWVNRKNISQLFKKRLLWLI